MVAVLVIGSVSWLSRRSGVSSYDLSRHMPGDDLVEVPNLICDRAVIIDASAQELWPWIAQLGKKRAGWYAPRWLELIVGWPKSKRGARKVLREFQSPQIGEVLPDWGGGGLRPVQISVDSTLVYQGVRPPFDPSARPQFSWTHVIEPVDDFHCRYYLRLRGRIGGPKFLAPLRILGGFFDYVTVAVMFAGLKERLKESRNDLAATTRLRK
jgi:hypothetical protein